MPDFNVGDLVRLRAFDGPNGPVPASRWHGRVAEVRHVGEHVFVFARGVEGGSVDANILEWEHVDAGR